MTMESNFTDGVQVTWRKGFEWLYAGADANRIYSEIRSIGDKATPEEIVDKARDENSELHKCFTWDDSKAAEYWRREEARKLTHMLIVVQEEAPSEKAPQAFYFTDHGTPSYKPTKLIFQNNDELDSLRTRFVNELRTIANRNRKFENDFPELFKIIDALPY